MKFKSIFILSLLICLSLATLAAFTSCGESITEGLRYELNDDGESYAVVDKGDAEGERIIIPSSYEGKPVTRIAKNAFSFRDFEYVKIPDSVKIIEAEAFSFNDDLEQVVFGNGVEFIGDCAFQSTQVKQITIPASVNKLGVGIFKFCHQLEEIKVEGGNEVFDSRNDCNAIVETATNTLREACVNTVIPNDIEAIGDFAFADRRGDALGTITIPDSVITIGNNAFSGCYDTSRFVIGNSVKTIGDNAFQSCEMVVELVLPDSVQTIGFAAFRDCESLDSIVIGTAVEYIGQIAFLGVGQQIEVRYRGTEEQWKQIELDGNAGFGYKIMVYNYEG